MTTARSQHSAVELNDGTVLIVGGASASNRSAELYDPSSGTFAATDGLTSNRDTRVAVKTGFGDVEAALRTAAAIGDDTLQKRAQGRVVPDSFTHGSAEQRQRWFETGRSKGQVAACNTFAAQQL